MAKKQSTAGPTVLTYAGGGEHPCGNEWWDTVGEDRLQHIVGEGEGDDCQCGWVHDEHGTPQQQEPTTTTVQRVGKIEDEMCQGRPTALQVLSLSLLNFKPD